VLYIGHLQPETLPACLATRRLLDLQAAKIKHIKSEAALATARKAHKSMRQRLRAIRPPAALPKDATKDEQRGYAAALAGYSNAWKAGRQRLRVLRQVRSNLANKTQALWFSVRKAIGEAASEVSRCEAAISVYEQYLGSNGTDAAALGSLAAAVPASPAKASRARAPRARPSQANRGPRARRRRRGRRGFADATLGAELHDEGDAAGADHAAAAQDAADAGADAAADADVLEDGTVDAVRDAVSRLKAAIEGLDSADAAAVAAGAGESADAVAAEAVAAAAWGGAPPA